MSRVGERAYIDITGLSMDGLIVGTGSTLFIKWCNAGRTPAWHFFACPLLGFGIKKAEGGAGTNRDVKGVETGFVGAGKEVKVSYKMSDLRVTPDIIEAVESGRQRMFISVYALYVDVYGERRVFDSHAVYEPDTGGFTDCYDDYQSEAKPN